MFKKYSLITLLLVFGACESKKNSVYQLNVPGIKTTVSRIQISPLAHDGARVAVVGSVVKVFEDNFVLTDTKGSTVLVGFSKDLNFNEGEQVLISGVFRHNKNTIEADQIIKIISDEDGIRPLNN